MLLLVLLVISSSRKTSIELQETTASASTTEEKPITATGMITRVMAAKDATQTKQLLKRIQKQVLQNQGFRLCQLKAPIPLPQEPRPFEGILKIPVDVSPLAIRFQCAGNAYEKFGHKLQDFLSLKKQQQEVEKREQKKITLWGQRAKPFPRPLDPSQIKGGRKFLSKLRPRKRDENEQRQRQLKNALAQNKKEKNKKEKNKKNPPKKVNIILFFGSTHLRQVVTALLCQYVEVVLKVERIYGHSKHSVSSMALHVTLQNNIHVYVIISPPFIYSPQWLVLLQRHVLKMSLGRMDYVVLGRFHKYTPQQGQALLEFLTDHEGNAHAEKHAAFDDEADGRGVVAEEPPTFLDVVDVYKGPIVYVSLFAPYGNFTYAHVQDSIRALWHGTEPPEEPFSKFDVRAQHAKIQFQHEASAGNMKIEANPISESAQSLFAHKGKPPKVVVRKKKKPTGFFQSFFGFGGGSERRQRQRRRRLEEEEREQQEPSNEIQQDGNGDDNENNPPLQQMQPLIVEQEDVDNPPVSETKANKAKDEDDEEFDDNENPNNPQDEEDDEAFPPLPVIRKKARDPITQRRTNLIAINARAYIDGIFGGEECATDQMKVVGSCITDPNHAHYAKGHRCFGKYGGHADLVAWDVIEAIYKLYNRQQQQKRNSLLGSIVGRKVGGGDGDGMDAPP